MLNLLLTLSDKVVSCCCNTDLGHIQFVKSGWPVRTGSGQFKRKLFKAYASISS